MSTSVTTSGMRKICWESGSTSLLDEVPQPATMTARVPRSTMTPDTVSLRNPSRMQSLSTSGTRANAWLAPNDRGTLCANARRHPTTTVLVT